MTRNGVLDTSLILSLGGASALDLLWDDPAHTWHITPIVRGEVISEPSRSQISRAILEGDLVTMELDTDSADEMKAFVEWSTSVDPGEAEAIAVGLSRSWTIGIEDRFAQRRLTSAVGPGIWVNAAGLLVAAVRSGLRSPSDADAIFKRLDCYSGYVKRGITSLSDLVG